MYYDHLFPRYAPVQAPGRFTAFRRLPAEIRNMIWEYALPEPRVYEVLDAPNAKQKTPAQQGLMFANMHHEPPPALAAVCQESRSFVLHHYQPLTLGATTKFVDMSRDMLLLEPYLLVKRLHRSLHFLSQIPLVRDRATRLALGTSYGIYPGIFHPVLGRKVSKNNMAKLLAGLAKFPRLKTLVFIVHQEFQFEFDSRFPGVMPTCHPLLPPVLNPVVPTGLGHSLPRASASAVASVTPLPRPPSTSTTPSPITTSSLLPFASPSPLSHPHLHPHSHPNPHPNPFSPPKPFISTSSSSEPQLQPRPQQVHQAYRFKFDIESNINSPPRRRPHTNELLYYPLDVDEDDDRDWNKLGRCGCGYGYGYVYGYSCDGEVGDEEEGEWCDPWPTNDDWRRFRRRFWRGMVAAMDLHGEGDKDKGLGMRECGRGGLGCGGDRNGDGRGCGGGVAGATGVEGGKDRVCLPELRLQGASLLWRYTRGVTGHFGN